MPGAGHGYSEKSPDGNGVESGRCKKRLVNAGESARADDLGGKRRAVAQRRCRRLGGSELSADAVVPLLGTRRGHHQLRAGRIYVIDVDVKQSMTRRRVTSAMSWCTQAPSQSQSKASGNPAGFATRSLPW